MSAAISSNVVAFPGRDRPESDENGPGVDLAKFRRAFTDYATTKTAEIDEQREAWRYYYGAQVSPEMLKVWKARGQPAIIFPMIDIVADGAVGIIAQTRGDPKAFPRTPNNDEAAEIATQCIRTVLDDSIWEPEETEAIRQAYVAGIAVAQIEFVEGDWQDDDVKVSRIDPKSFYYDPRSIEADFSDARYMGVSKWSTPDEVDELFPDRGEEVQDALDGGELTTAFDTDTDNLWAQGRKRVRLVEHWYRERREWRFCFYAGNVELMSGVSPYVDEKGRTICRFFAFANRIDHDGDHHGFVRRLKGPQDAINQHRSKAIHIMNTRQLKVRRSALDGDLQDLATLRREAARPDGVILYDNDPGDIEIITADAGFLQQTRYYEDAKAQMDQFGPTHVAMMSGDKSGRALAMMMQAGMAQLGPFVTNLRSWRLRIYRAIWSNVKRSWTNERMIRVTADQDAPKFLAVNQVARDPYGNPMMGHNGGPPMMTNAVSSMNVDIILDEGANSVNVMSDVFDLLSTLAQNKVPIPPAALIEASSLPSSIKQKLLGILSQPDPAQEAGNQATIENKNADTAQKLAKAEHDRALASREHVGAHVDLHSAVIDGAAAVHGMTPPPQPMAPGMPQPFPSGI